MVDGLSKAARNERTKLRANSVNGIGLAFAVTGIIQPSLAGDLLTIAAIKALLCAAIGFILHRYAIDYLARLED